jgi:DNA-binding FadR family transcriptional regulator
LTKRIVRLYNRRVMPTVEPSFPPPRRTGLHRDVVDALGRRIVTGVLAPGHVLVNEASLSIGMDVSRTVAREAIQVLAAKGLVASRPKVGTRVLPRDQWNLFDPDVLAWSLEAADAAVRYDEIYEVRMIIEPRVASLAAERRTPAEAAHLAEMLEAMRAGVSDYATFVAADLEVHSAILGAAHNDLLAQLAEMIRLVLNACQRVSACVAEGRSRAVEEHRAVVDAIAGQAPDEAAQATERLLSSAARDLREVLATGNEDGNRAPAADPTGEGSRPGPGAESPGITEEGGG